MPFSDWYGDDAATFGDRLTAAREASGLDVPGLASRLGVKDTTLAAWEQDIKAPRANRLQMLAGMLGVSLSWLLTGQGDGILPPSDDAAEDETDPGLDRTAILADLRRLQLAAAALSNDIARVEKRLRHTPKDRP